MHRPIQPYWKPLAGGVALGLVLLLTFFVTGHGLGATGFFTRLTAWLGGALFSQATHANHYLGPMLDRGQVLNNWITWQVIGVALGAGLASISTGRFRVQVDGAHKIGIVPRLVLVLVGGILAGAGARFSAGCTSGMGLSGGATLAVAGFLFLAAFFVAGYLASLLMQRMRT
jgi:uncharacterized membrane protein YedE/YeeE